jgi:DNA-directed RNA polymerase subunit A"
MKELFNEYKDLVPKKILDELESNLPSNTKKGDVKRLLEILQTEYDTLQVDSGESVGLIAAESLGEQGTQVTLNTKHFQGVAELNITVGLPRIIEICDARKTLQTPLTDIFLAGKKWDQESVAKFAAKIKESSLDEVSDSFEVDMANATVKVNLNKEVSAQKSLRPSNVVKKLEKGLKNVAIKNDGDTILIKLQKEGNDLNKLYALKEQAKKVYVSGLKGIRQVLPIKKGDDYIIKVAGTNLKDMFKMEEIDATRTKSNDLYEIASVLGIEAARQLIIEEINAVIEEQGLNIDMRHVMLIADVMTSTGEVKGITRYGIVGEKSSVLARASFETPINHLVFASLHGEVDPLSSVVENVMINQPVPCGTGMAKLISTLRPKKEKIIETKK